MQKKIQIRVRKLKNLKSYSIANTILERKKIKMARIATSSTPPRFEFPLYTKRMYSPPRINRHSRAYQAWENLFKTALEPV